MKTRLSVLACVLGLALSGCQDNDASIEVFGVCGFPEDAEQCVTSGKCDTLLAARPFAATRVLGFQNSFDVYVEVRNQMPPNGDTGTFRVNTNDFTIEEYRLSFSSNPPLPIPSFTSPINHIVPAGGSVTPLIPLIPFEVMRVIDAADPVYAGTEPGAVVSVELRLFGHLRDGTEIETAPWVVPVDVLDVDAGLPLCPKAGEVVTAICPHAGQTASVTCEEP